MNKNNHDPAKQLVELESFVDWVLHPNDESTTRWKKWLEKNPSQSKEFQEAKEFISAIHFNEEKLSAQEVNDLLGNIHQKTTNSTSKTKTRFIFRYAAAAVLLGFIAIASYIYNANLPKVISTSLAEKESINLEDGSVVTLGESSTLKVKKHWNSQDLREVWLTGKAYFDVTSTPSAGTHRFVVHTDAADINVLGTKFEVSNVKGKTHVVLDEGKVEVIQNNHKNQSAYLAPDEIIVVEENELVKTENINTEIYTSWKNDYLVLDTISLPEILEILEKSFDYECRFEGIQPEEIENISFSSNTYPLDALIPSINQILVEYGISINEDANSKKLVVVGESN